MNGELDRVLVDAGDRWRAAQPPAPSIDAAMFMDGGRRAPRARLGVGMAVAGVAVAIVASFGLGRLTAEEPSAGLDAKGAKQATGSAIAPVTPTSPSTATCAVTRPNPVFVAPKPFLATPPDPYGSNWFGSAHLWTMLRPGGEIWDGWVRAKPPVLPQKTFWWSADWRVSDEPEPTIIVTGRRLDGPGSFTFGPGTNASADFGTAMLVGIDIPSYGCWELTARYRLATLRYVVAVGP